MAKADAFSTTSLSEGLVGSVLLCEKSAAAYKAN
jgi:hypothetical protein